jgi:hypothetical protein
MKDNYQLIMTADSLMAQISFVYRPGARANEVSHGVD